MTLITEVISVVNEIITWLNDVISALTALTVTYKFRLTYKLL